MSSENLFKYTLEKLKENIVTRTIPQKLQIAEYNPFFGEKICKLLFEFYDKDLNKYADTIKDFIDFSAEFLTLQMELNKTGTYKFKKFEDTKREVLDNPQIMAKRYLNGLFLSQAFWINHYKLFDFFIQNFCKGNISSGNILEVPIGTGIFISEFIRNNPAWKGKGYDLSKSAVDFAKKIIRINNSQEIEVAQKNVFDISETIKYDKIICGELLEHVENPKDLLSKLNSLLSKDGELFLTTAIWAAGIDHIFLFKSVKEVRTLINSFFNIKKELVLPVFPNKRPDDEKTAINYACILSNKSIL
ncbi:class I SAM-dependent methyltransferase [Candidatus Woesearchaeota archaeon]|nr:class I SAM-dependent methyltransferase [Candidatus Woesearchaeota archaeon]